MPLMTRDDTSATDASGDVRRTLAQRIAHRNRQRSERLAGLHVESADVVPLQVRDAGAGPASPDTAITRTRISRDPERVRPGTSETSTAMNEFIDALQDGLSGTAVPPGGVMRFEVGKTSARRAAVPVCDLDRLTGAGPGLIWALRRTGICSLGDMARLDPADLIDRLGILGRMIPAETWIRTARTATGQ